MVRLFRDSVHREILNTGVTEFVGIVIPQFSVAEQAASCLNNKLLVRYGKYIRSAFVVADSDSLDVRNAPIYIAAHKATNGNCHGYCIVATLHLIPQWVLTDTKGLASLKSSSAVIPASIGEHDVLVKLEAVSLNYRDIIIVNGGNPFPIKSNVVPGSDGAGIVAKTGSSVTEFREGDRVVTTLMRDYIAGPLTRTAMLSSLGAAIDGTIREYGVFPEHGLVRIADHLTMPEASTLPCAGVTAWASLYGDAGLKPGDVVITQGTSGVSLFALQFAVAAGATVVATTSSAEKGELLKKLGAKHVINYKTEANWGETAKRLTKDGAGVDVIVEVGGAWSIRQSLKAIKMGGTISLVGNVGSSTPLDPPFNPMEVLGSQATLRSIGCGNRQLFVDMMKAVDAAQIKPVVDKSHFTIDQVKDAYKYMTDRKHLGKVVIDLRLPEA